MVYGFGQAVNLISPLLITPYLIYTCGLEKLGVIAIGQAMAYILIVFVDYSSYIVGVKEIAINRNDQTKLEELFTTIYVAKAILFLGVVLLCVTLLFLIPNSSNYALPLLYSLAIVAGQFINPTWFFQGVENFSWITIINVLGKVLYVAGVLVFIHSADAYVYANFWLGFGAVIANLIGVGYILHRYGFSFKRFSFTAVKTLLVSDFSFCVSQFFFAVRNYAAVMIIGFFAGDFVAGKFKVIEQIITLLRTYLQLFFKFSYSYVCFEIDQNVQKGLRLWQKFNGLNYLLLLLIVAVLYAYSAQTLLFFKVDPHLVPGFVSYLQLALIIPLLIGITLPLEQLLFGLNKNKVYIQLTIGSTIVNVSMTALVMRYFELKQVLGLFIFIEAALIFCYYLVLKPYFSATKTTA